MRRFMCVIILAGCAFGQAMTEFAAAAAGSTVGAAGGKKLSDSISSVLGKASGALEKSAADPSIKVAPIAKEKPLQVGVDPSGVPAPPPVVRTAPQEQTLPSVTLTQAQVELPDSVRAISEPLPQLAPPPKMTREALGQLAQGMSRSDVLSRGVPASKLSMFEDGHFVEVYSYRESGQKFGTVRLKDGALDTVQAQ